VYTTVDPSAETFAWTRVERMLGQKLPNPDESK
jgi:hypothetical protein